MEYTVHPSEKRVVLKGTVTENDDLSPLVSQIPHDAVCDVSGITRINSAGIRQWLRFIRALSEDVQLSFEGCTVPFVTQLNLIDRFVGTARIVSLYVPYLCTTCDATHDALISMSSVEQGRILGDPPQCSKCAIPMELDIDIDDYLSFLNTTKK